MYEHILNRAEALYSYINFNGGAGQKRRLLFGFLEG